VRIYRSNNEAHGLGVKGALGFTLAGAADETVVDDILALIREERNGDARIPLVATLARLKDGRAHDALVALQSDPKLGTQARVSLKKLRRRKPPHMHS